MVKEFSPVPLVNKLLVIAQEEAAKNGHLIEAFSRDKQDQGITYTATCRICSAEINVICTTSKYERNGSAYKQGCKPG